MSSIFFTKLIFWWNGPPTFLNTKLAGRKNLSITDKARSVKIRMIHAGTDNCSLRDVYFAIEGGGEVEIESTGISNNLYVFE